MSTRIEPAGVLLIDKTAGPTSHDVVAAVRQLIHAHLVDEDQGTKRRHRAVKVGHAGTLDPFATGLLLLGIGSATRLLEYSHSWHKEYEAKITLGATSDTDDGTGTIVAAPEPGAPTLADIESVLPQFFGTITQQPPSYAAIKVKGKKLYEYARAGEKVAAPPRQITIHEIAVLDYHYPVLSLRIRCEGGTYIRALARDIGAALGTGGYCSWLRRTQHGQHLVASAALLADIAPTTLVDQLHPSDLLTVGMTQLMLTDTQVSDFGQGRQIHLTKPITETEHIAVLDPTGTLIGTGSYNAVTKIIAPNKVLL
tara:strand:- start:672 stop:1604 length:933 start_codon:yes stop_codon:yes gene_type:complete